MPSFNTLPPHQPPIPAGVYVAKVINARECILEAGNGTIVMKLMIPDGRTIGSILTFVPNARVAINAFCDSADLPRPSDPDVAVDLTAARCLGRYLYITVTVVIDNAGGLQSRVNRFLTCEEAVALNPEQAKVFLKEQAPLKLPRTKSNPFNA
jgi:hypothetical protein